MIRHAYDKNGGIVSGVGFPDVTVTNNALLGPGSFLMIDSDPKRLEH